MAAIGGALPPGCLPIEGHESTPSMKAYAIFNKIIRLIEEENNALAKNMIMENWEFLCEHIAPNSLSKLITVIGPSPKLKYSFSDPEF